MKWQRCPPSDYVDVWVAGKSPWTHNFPALILKVNEHDRQHVVEMVSLGPDNEWQPLFYAKVSCRMAAMHLAAILMRQPERWMLELVL